MTGFAFEWDPTKANANRWKHRVGFEEASTVFGDPLSITIAEQDHEADEDRSIIVGMSRQHRLLVVIHTVRGTSIRLISARPATRHEKSKYEEAIH